jgi:hypothetical protein
MSNYPGSPRLVAQFDDDEGNSLWGVHVSGKYAYYATNDEGIYIMDISNPTDPKRVARLDYGGGTSDLFAIGKYLYVAASWGGLKILDISEPVNPVEVASYATSDAESVFVSGKYAYVTDYFDGLLVFDISDPTDLVLVDSFDDGGQGNDVKVVNGFAYVADGSDGLEIINVSNPSQLAQLSQLDDGGTATDIYISGGYAYVADDNNGLEIINITDPTSPSEIGSYMGSNEVSGVFVAGDFAYLACGYDGYHILDVSNKASPILVTAISTGFSDGRDIVVSGRYAYMADSLEGFMIYEINGAEISALSAGSIETNDISVAESVHVGQNAYIDEGLVVGSGGIRSDGPASFNNHALTVGYDGNVGVGIAYPSERFSVAGNVNVTDNITAKYICDETGANCKDISAGWGSASEGETEDYIFDADNSISGPWNVVASGSNDINFDNDTYYIDVDQNKVGIGTAIPIQPLHIYRMSGDNTLLVETDGNNSSFLQLDANRTTDGNVGIIRFSISNDSIAAVNGKRDGANDAGALSFGTQPTGGTVTERMRISSTGNVGIGTTAPLEKLVVAGNANISQRLFVSNLSIGTSNSIRQLHMMSPASGAFMRLESSVDAGHYMDIIYDATGNYFDFQATSSRSIAFTPGLATSMYLANDGNVGIGTTIPEQRISVDGNISATGWINSSMLFIRDLVRISPTSSPPQSCTPSYSGAVYYDSDVNVHCACNSTEWVQMDDYTTICS